MSNVRDMIPQVRRPLLCDPDLAALSRRCVELDEHCIGLDYEINKALGLPATTSLLTSLDASLSYIRANFPQPDWRYGFQDAGYKGYTGPLAWINNGACQREGFENRINHDYRYFERSARTIEYAFAALVLHAASYRNGTLDSLVAKAA